MVIRVSALLLTLACVFYACAPDTRESITYEKGGFAVAFPGTPETQIKKLDGFGGEAYMTVLLCEESHSAYFVGYLDLPDEMLQDLDPIRFLKGGRDRALARRQGRLRWEREIRLDGNPGIEFEADISQGDTAAVLRARNVLVGRRYFQVFGLAKSAEVSLTGVNRFLRSFELK